jgi:transposase
MEPPGLVADNLRDPGQGNPERYPLHRQHLDQGPPIGSRRKRGASAQAIGRSRGGRTTKIHAITDGEGRLFRFALTVGQYSDVKAGYDLAAALPPKGCLIADMAYDALRLRQQLAFQGTASVIPTNPRHKRKWPIDLERYKERNLVERMFSRLKDFRRIATRYDKLARNYASAIALVAVVIWWCD